MNNFNISKEIKELDVMIDTTSARVDNINRTLDNMKSKVSSIEENFDEIEKLLKKRKESK